MLKKTVRYLFPISLALALAACSSLRLPGSSTPTPQNQQGGLQSQFDPANQPLETRLALGTLALEGTSNAVTADEAKTLAPLWKGVKALSASSTASQAEIDALYKQIEDSMTPAQIDAIKNLKLSQQDSQALMQKYGIQFPQGNFGGANGTPGAPNISQDQIATLRAERSSRAGSGQNGGTDGFIPGQGGFGRGAGDQGGSFVPGQGGFTQRTPQPGATCPAGRNFRGGMNTIFVDPLISLLDQRAGGTTS